MEKYRWSIIHFRLRLNWGKARKRGRKHLHRKYVSLLRSIRVRYAPVSNVCVCVCLQLQENSFIEWFHALCSWNAWMNEWMKGMTDIARLAPQPPPHCSRTYHSLFADMRRRICDDYHWKGYACTVGPGYKVIPVIRSIFGSSQKQFCSWNSPYRVDVAQETERN